MHRASPKLARSHWTPARKRARRQRSCTEQLQRRSMRGECRSSDECRYTRSFAAPLCSLIRLQVERACSFGPIARAILYQFLELDLGVGNAGDDAEVLTQVIARSHLVDVLFGRPHQRVDSFAFFQR